MLVHIKCLMAVIFALKRLMLSKLKSNNKIVYFRFQKLGVRTQVPMLYRLEF